jgi:glycosyltransferase involved in cell wall biosynthesis
MTPVTPPAAPAVGCVIPAKDEAARIAATVTGAARIDGVDVVVVVDDGSADDTAQLAREAGAVVVRHPVNRGKAAAMETGAVAVSAIDSTDGRTRALLFLDADLAETAVSASPLVPPVLHGEADMTIATLPVARNAGGGRGLVVRLARDGIARATGWRAEQPLSGQRCLTRAAFDAALPLAPGFGVEVGLSIDLLRQGFRVREVEVELHHRVTGTDWAAQRHRARQWKAVATALSRRGVVPHPGTVRGPRGG